MYQAATVVPLEQVEQLELVGPPALVLVLDFDSPKVSSSHHLKTQTQTTIPTLLHLHR